MSSETEEMQKEEIESLTCIYEGDENFKQISPKVYQYKVLQSHISIRIPNKI